MNLLAAFFRLIRWPNLLFIALTQILFYYFILPFVYRDNYFIAVRTFSQLHFYLLVIASVCIAAAGYIINDYFDLNIDLVNKPSKLIIGKYIKRRWAIVFHIIFSLIGFLISCYVGYNIGNFYIPFFNLLAIGSLWIYSTILKKKLLIGNILISILTGWVIMVISVAEYKYQYPTTISSGDFVTPRLLKLTFLYTGFAFIISLIREVIKDMEDMSGDAKYGCKTMPIVWGIPVTKVFVGVWLVVLIGTVTALQFYVFQFGWWLSVLYSSVLIVAPLCWTLKKLYGAQTSLHYHQLSSMIKFVMLTGILSMMFFKIYL
ncbi:MAG: geranylgeranylglycerol-phosphate geranylgeranyltransferase [Chitinophagaceae bacterium]|nr:geranylgeranylglycerol-phosphate geranylgeranyltransferase [Chitinophagaceae bacterium]